MSNEQPLLHPLIDKDSLRDREAKRRKKQYDTAVVDPAAVSEHEQNGWIVERRLSNRVRLRRPKDENERLENRFWYLLFRLGYKVLNQGRDFKVAISQRGSEAVLRQIDVFAKDEETVIVAECRAYTAPKRRSLQKEIEEFASVKGAIAAAVKKHCGPSQKPKIIWMFVTENLIWSAPDRERAAEQNIHVVTERELRYYLQLAEHLGPAGRFQFLAEFLGNQPVPGLAGRVIPAIRGRLGGRKFYSFVTTPRILLKIAFVNHRSLNDPDGAPSYQRLVNRTRMRQIGRFLSDGGFFPTNLLINFSRPVRLTSYSATSTPTSRMDSYTCRTDTNRPGSLTANIDCTATRTLTNAISTRTSSSRPLSRCRGRKRRTSSSRLITSRSQYQRPC